MNLTTGLRRIRYDYTARILLRTRNVRLFSQWKGAFKWYKRTFLFFHGMLVHRILEATALAPRT